MTKKDFKSKTKELITLVKEDLLKESLRLFDSGAINIKEYQNDFRLPKIILNAALDKSMNDWRPLTKESNEAIENLKHF